MPESVTIMSTPVNLTSKSEVLNAIELATSQLPVQIATLNPEMMLEAQKNSAFRTALSKMTHCTVDGSGLFFFLRLYRRRQHIPKHIELYHGSDTINDLFARYQKGEKRFYFIGGPTGLAESAADALRGKYPKIAIVGATDGGYIPSQPTEIDSQTLSHIQSAKPDILVAGFGSPKQEIWIQLLSQKLAIPVMIGVGGSFGFYKTKKRAPQWMRTLHLEWFFRALTEPNHWRRVFRATVVFSFQAFFWIARSKQRTGNSNS